MPFNIKKLFYKAYRLVPKKQLIKEIDGITYKLDLNEIIDSSIFHYGCFEEDTSKVINDFIKKGMVVLDIGANTGCHTLRLSKLVGNEGKVYSFEPQHDIFMCLCGNLFMNQCFNVFPFEYAAYSRNTKFSVGDLNTIGNLASTAFIPDKNGNIAAVMIDDIITEKIDFIKCDAQGGDLDALIGCQNIIDKFKPKIIFEREPDMTKKYYNRDWNDYILFFKSKQYEIEEIVESNFLAQYIG